MNDPTVRFYTTANITATLNYRPTSRHYTENKSYMCL